MEIDRAIFGENHPHTAKELNNLGLVFSKLGEKDAACRCYETALAIDEATFGPDHPHVARDAYNLSRTLMSPIELAKVRRCLERALQIDEAAFGPRHPAVLRDAGALADYHRSLGLPEKAVQYFQQCLAVAYAVDAQHEVHWALDSLGTVYLMLGETNQAARYLKQALEMAIELKEEPLESITRFNLARLHVQEGRLVRALQEENKALVIWQKGVRFGESWLSAFALNAFVYLDYILIGCLALFQWITPVSVDYSSAA